MSLLSWALSNGDLPEVAIIGVNHSVAGDGGWINVETTKLMDLFLCQVSWIAVRERKTKESQVLV